MLGATALLAVPGGAARRMHRHWPSLYPCRYCCLPGCYCPAWTTVPDVHEPSEGVRGVCIGLLFFLRIIKFYLFQVFEERNLLFVDRACNMNSLLISIIDSHMFEHSGMNASSHATHCIE